MKRIIQDKLALIFLITGFILNFAIWVFLFLKIKPTDLPITLHYNVYFGVDYLGRYTEVYVIPIIGLIVLLANAALGAYIFPKSKIAAKMLIAAVPIIQLLLAVSAVAIAVFNL